jgi:hypothetical protein
MTNTITNDTTLEPRSAEVPSEPCAEEAEWIRREHEILTYDAAAFIERAAALGETLVKTKEKVKAALGGHGAWGPWVERNLPNISDRTVRRYMEIFRRKSEPLALEDPGAFLAEVHGHRELPPPDAAPASKTDAASDLPSDGKKSPPPPSSKRPRKAAKAKTPPPTETVPGQQAGSVSLETHLDLAAEALERAVAEWKRGSLAPLREAARGNERISGGLERLERDLDLLTKRLHDYARILHR